MNEEDIESYISDVPSVSESSVIDSSNIEEQSSMNTMFFDIQQKIQLFFSNKENIMQFTAILLLIIYISFANIQSTPSFFKSNIWKVSSFIIVIFVITRYPSISLGLSICLVLSIMYSELNNFFSRQQKKEEEEEDDDDDDEEEKVQQHMLETFQNKSTNPNLPSMTIKNKLSNSKSGSETKKKVKFVDYFTANPIVENMTVKNLEDIDAVDEEELSVMYPEEVEEGEEGEEVEEVEEDENETMMSLSPFSLDATTNYSKFS